MKKIIFAAVVLSVFCGCSSHKHSYAEYNSDFYHNPFRKEYHTPPVMLMHEKVESDITIHTTRERVWEPLD